MDITIPALLMVANLGLYLAMCRRELFGRTILLTPVVVFGAFEIISVWAAPFVAYVEGTALDGYPAAVVALSFLAFLFGVAATRYGLRVRVGEPRRFLDQPILDRPGWGRSYGAGAVLLVGLLIGVGLLLYQGLPPQLRLFAEAIRQGQPLSLVMTDMSAYRFELSKAHLFGGAYRGQGIMRVFLSSGWLYVLCLALVRMVAARNSPERRRWAKRMAYLSVFSLFFVSGDGTRAPFIFLMAQLLTAYSLLMPLKKSAVAGVALAGFALVVGLSLTSHKSMSWMRAQSPIQEGVQVVFERISVGNGMSNVNIIELIREGTFDYMDGEVHLRGLLAALPGTHFSDQPFSNILAETMSNRWTTTYLTSTYLGTLYHDFGLIGCLMGYALIGMVLQGAQHYFFRRPKRATSLPLVLLLFAYLGMISLYGWISVLPKFAILACCDLVVRFLCRMRRAPSNWVGEAASGIPAVETAGGGEKS